MPIAARTARGFMRTPERRFFPNGFLHRSAEPDRSDNASDFQRFQLAHAFILRRSQERHWLGTNSPCNVPILFYLEVISFLVPSVLCSSRFRLMTSVSCKKFAIDCWLYTDHSTTRSATILYRSSSKR